MHFLTLEDITSHTFIEIIQNSIKFKEQPSTINSKLKDKNIGLLFEKPSTRTKISFDVGIRQMKGNSILINPNDIQSSRGESLEDTIIILSKYLDALIIRTYEHEKLISMSQNSSIPIINALSNKTHPCQILADFMTIYEEFQSFEPHICFLGNGTNNIAYSLILASALLKTKITIACPTNYQPSKEVLQIAQQWGGTVIISHDPIDAVKTVDAIYTDTWVSMGFEDKVQNIEKEMLPFQINTDLMLHTQKHTIILHCLPAYRGKEITSDTFSHKNLRIYQQAENRLHSQKALLNYIL